MSRARLWLAVHRKAILGAALTAAASVAGYLWPQDPWIVTIIGALAVGLGVGYVPNRGTGQVPDAPDQPQVRALPR